MCSHSSPKNSNRCPLFVALLAALLPVSALAAPRVEFNSSMLFGDAAGIDLSRFESGDILPGTYNVDIIVNDVVVGRKDVTARMEQSGEVSLCLAPELVEMLGLDLPRLEQAQWENEAILALPAGSVCQSIAHFVPSATQQFDMGEQTLQFSIPQVYLARMPRGWVDPAEWDHGITAAMLSYDINHRRTSSAGRQDVSTSSTINAGLNLGAWRVRHSGYLHKSSSDGLTYQASRSYAQRDLQSLGAQLTVGEAATLGDMFDTVSYSGVNISTDPRMLPDSQREYAPVVRGVAQTNARVTIRQRGYVIHEVTVAPGAFEIDDLYGTGGSGDLEVEITEADGRVERFTVAYAAMPQLLREGQRRYSLTAARLRDPGTGHAAFVEATLRRGISNNVTVFGGATLADDYRSAVLGAAINTPAGAFSGDVTFSDALMPDSDDWEATRKRGQSLRLSYSKTMFSQSTNLTLAAYRYSTEGFLSLNDAARLQHQLSGIGSAGRQRSRLDLTISQRLGDRGGLLNFSGSTADYWDQGRRQTNFSVGYSNRIGRGSYSINVRRSLQTSLFSDEKTRQDTSASLSFSMPLGVAPQAPRAAVNVNRDGRGEMGYRIGVTGTFGEERQGNYNASLNDQSGSRGFNAGMNYQFPLTSLSASYSQSQGAKQLSVSSSGGLVVHGGGITLAQSLGDTIGVVHVPGATGAGVGSMDRIKIDRRGYAVAPYLSPYRRNDIGIDPTGLPLDVELEGGSVAAVPTAGAVVKMVLPTVVGRNALIEALLPDGSPLPFGADVLNEAGAVVGVVGQGSRLWVRGLDEEGVLTVHHGVDQRCSVSYDIRSVAAEVFLESKCVATLENVAAADVN